MLCNRVYLIDPRETGSTLAVMPIGTAGRANLDFIYAESL